MGKYTSETKEAQLRVHMRTGFMCDRIGMIIIGRLEVV